MELGYSILLGELLPASELHYDDCKNLQVVCIACNEPIFKVHREPGARAGCDYFAHYDRKLSVGVDCDARVRAQINQNGQGGVAESRGQRLRYFLSVMPTAVARQPVFVDGGSKIIKSIAKQKGYRAFRSYLVRSIRDLATPSFRDQLFNELQAALDTLNFSADRDLPSPARLRIARELFDLLFVPSSDRALAKVLDLSLYHRAMINRSIVVEEKHDDEWLEARVHYDIYRAICSIPPSNVQPLLKNLESSLFPLCDSGNDDEAHQKSTIDEFTHVSALQVGTELMCLPFVAMLRDKYGDRTVERAYVDVFAKARELSNADETALVGERPFAKRKFRSMGLPAIHWPTNQSNAVSRNGSD